MTEICGLCDQKKELMQSHLIPKFVFSWSKSTSVTGYLRQAINANLRRQDGDKRPLLCGDCEQIIGSFESEFAKRVFYPYVNKELNNWGSATGKMPFFTYEEWLLKFIISLLLRHILTFDKFEKKINKDKLQILYDHLRYFKEYLLSKRKDIGNNRSYVIFLQNLAFGRGHLPPNINKNINFYLLKATDGTVATGKNVLGIYIKLGPIVIFTSFIPTEIKVLEKLAIKKKGLLTTAQKLKGSQLVKFIFIDRPNEAMKFVKISDKQQKIIQKSYSDNPEKATESMTAKTILSDQYLESIKADV